MITTLPVVGNAVSGASRRRLYRHSKRVLTRLLGRRWSGPRWTMEPAVRRFLRARPRSFLGRLLGDRGFALAAAVSLAATGTAGAVPPIELSDVAAGTGGFIINGIDPLDRSGFSVSGAGDVNGDGLVDFIVGARRADPGGNSFAGESYVVFGPDVINLTQGTVFGTIAAAIASAVDGDELLAVSERFAAEPDIDFLGKALTLRSTGTIDQPAGGLYTLADNAALEAAPGQDITLAGELLAPAGADVDVLAGALFVPNGGALTAAVGAGIFVTADAGAAVDGTTTLDAGAIVTFSGDLIFGATRPSFNEHLISTTANQATSVFAADVDGDGDTDVLSASFADHKIAWYENDGLILPGFTEHVISTIANIAKSVFAADVDGDGDTDVLSASFNGSKIAWYENDGAILPGFTEHVISTTADGAISVFATDVDSDEDTDVLSASFFDDKIAWYENDGAMLPGFTEHMISTTADEAFSVFAANVDGDGDTDVLSASANDHKIAWYENDGAILPGFTEHVISTTANLAQSVFATDVDGDGDTDVLSASFNDSKIAWYENLGGSTSLGSGSVLAAAGAIDNGHPLGVFAGTVSSGGPLTNQGLLTLFGGSLEAGSGLLNAGTLEGYGDIFADVANDGQAVFVADTQVVGDYDNAGTTIIQNGTLTVLGSLTNTGTLIGDFFGGAAASQPPPAQGNGFFVAGGLSAGAEASLLMASATAVVRIGGAFDVAIDDNDRYHMAQAQLRMVGLAGSQALEVMSQDIGPVPEGLDRTQPGHYPIGTLRIGPTATTVNLVDNHDNDGLGQGAPEAIYVEALIVEAGAMLNTNGTPVYYSTLTLDGAVDNPANLMEIVAVPPCPTDTNNDGVTNVLDLIDVLLCFGQPDTPPCDTGQDTNGDGTVNVLDLIDVLLEFGQGCP